MAYRMAYKIKKRPERRIFIGYLAERVSAFDVSNSIHQNLLKNLFLKG